jgi:hypothetical protein
MMATMTDSGRDRGAMDLEALADEVVQLQTAGTTPDAYTLAEMHDEAFQRLLRLHAFGGERKVLDHITDMRRLLDKRRHPVPPEVAAAGAMSLWAAAYSWASTLTTLAGYTPQAHAEKAPFDQDSAPDPGPTLPRILLAHAITAAARDANITATTVTGLDTLARLALAELEECLEPALAVAALLNPHHGQHPSLGEPGHAQFRELLDRFELGYTTREIVAEPALMDSVRASGEQLAGELSQAASAVGHAIDLVTQAESDQPTLAWLYPYLEAYLGRPGAQPDPDAWVATMMEQTLGWPGGLPPHAILTAPGPWKTLVIVPYARADRAQAWARWLVGHGLADADGGRFSIPAPASYVTGLLGIALDLGITCGPEPFVDPVTGADHPSAEFLRRYGIGPQ